jgi:carboxypeptidase Taq
MSSKLQLLITELKKISHLRSINSVLSWDQQVKMPQGGAQARSSQLQLLSGIIHDWSTAKTLGELIQEASRENPTDLYDKQVIALARKDFEKNNKIPKELVEESAKLESEGFELWVKAKKENKFEEFATVLQKFIDLKQKIAKCIDSSKPSLDVLIDEFDPDMTTKRLDELFSSVKGHLVKLIQDIETSKKNGNTFDVSFLSSKDPLFPVKDQEALGREISKDIGFSFTDGRLDVSAHPFTINVDKHDVRITTRYKETEFFEGLTGTVHETGHALYEQGRNEKYYGTPVSNAHGMSLHESQSLLWERHVGLSKGFWTKYWPQVQKTFPHIDSKIEVSSVYLAVNEVQPSLIRVEADEVTYPMHIILRFEIEKGLFDGTIKVEDLPRVWNEKMKEYLGIVPEGAAQGVLQDIHWALGAFGYFPSYLIGAMCAAQIFAKMESSIDSIHSKIENGKFEELKNWLNKNIHEKGSVMSLDDLMKEVTGEKLNTKHYIDYMEKKYKAIYKLQ